jgi:hypothetical protein
MEIIMSSLLSIFVGLILGGFALGYALSWYAHRMYRYTDADIERWAYDFGRQTEALRPEDIDLPNGLRQQNYLNQQLAIDRMRAQYAQAQREMQAQSEDKDFPGHVGQGKFEIPDNGVEHVDIGGTTYEVDASGNEYPINPSNE